MWPGGLPQQALNVLTFSSASYHPLETLLGSSREVALVLPPPASLRFDWRLVTSCDFICFSLSCLKVWFLGTSCSSVEKPYRVYQFLHLGSGL